MKSEVFPAVEWSWKYVDVGGYSRLCGASFAIADISEHQQQRNELEQSGSRGGQWWLTSAGSAPMT